jgi:hypothetical protein
MSAVGTVNMGVSNAALTDLSAQFYTDSTLATPVGSASTSFINSGSGVYSFTGSVPAGAGWVVVTSPSIGRTAAGTLTVGGGSVSGASQGISL